MAEMSVSKAGALAVSRVWPLQWGWGLEAGGRGCCPCFPKSHGMRKKWSRW